MTDDTPPFDLLIVGGGVNGAGIACDAAGRGLKVALIEQDDLASATSSASSKLIHGGLRYLEYYQFRLVRESLRERDVLLRKAPHIVGYRQFVLPLTHARRPPWMLRLGLYLYDALAWPTRLPRSRAVDLGGDALGRPLKGEIARGFVYPDCWVDDARLVALNAVAAAAAGARVMTRTRLIAAERAGDRWRARVKDSRDGRESALAARALVNAAGPWVTRVRDLATGGAGAESRGVRLVKGSHLVLPRLYAGEQAYILQNPDGRVVFVLPYEGAFSIIGTTEVAFEGDPASVAIDAAEADYICASVNNYVRQPVAPADAVWSYAGIRPLFDDKAASASAVTRDYVLDLDGGDGKAPLLSVFGGKITTYRKLAEHALEKLKPFFPRMAGAWTADAPLPGGDLPEGFAAFAAALARDHPALDAAWLARLARRHGSRARMILAGVGAPGDLGRDFGGGLSEREVMHLIATEWAETADDVLWRRTKCGLHMTAQERDAVAAYFASRRSG